jgi:hypothetical protein
MTDTSPTKDENQLVFLLPLKDYVAIKILPSLRVAGERARVRSPPKKHVSYFFIVTPHPHLLPLLRGEGTYSAKIVIMTQSLEGRGI